MEQARLFIAIGISFAVFALWSIFLAPKPPEQAPQETAQTEAETAPMIQEPSEPQVAVPQPRADEPPAPADVTAPEAASALPGRTISVENDLYRIELSERGAAVNSIVLKNYRETIEKDSGRKELIHENTYGGSALLFYRDSRDHHTQDALFTMNPSQETIQVGSQPQTVTFQHQTDNGVLIEKAYTFRPDTYLIDLDIRITNRETQPVQGQLGIALRNSMKKDAVRYGFVGPSGLIGGNLKQVKFKDIEEQPKIDGDINWVAIEDLYFMTSIIPKQAITGQMLMDYKDDQLQNQLVFGSAELPPGQMQAYSFKLFMGPKSLSLLRKLNNELDRAINFGWFDFLAKPCLMLMNFIYRFIPNYGIAIIILTIVTRALFWPLARKSYKSMSEMRKLQPIMQEIKEKYKDDKAKMNQEMMTLYRTYKINPMGGCLPMLIQLPVFFALYRMLYQAIELRHAPFFGWITDLSAPDRLFEFGFKIPFMDPPYGIPVLTIIMGASMILQQKMTPTPGDPTQAKMMMLMPVIFTVIFINFSSGLVLYWLVSNIFSMAQQYYTQKKAA
jgi:YidC/Oxa1 family membrane protein insertase